MHTHSLRPLRTLLRQPDAWRCINDPVMGGESTSTVRQTDAGALCFSGHVSLANNGGFASARGSCTVDLSEATGLALRVHGPARRYRLSLFTEAGGRISYRAPFWTTPQPAWHYLPCSQLQAMRRGQPRPDAPPFDPATVHSIGFLIGGKQDGPFALHVHNMCAYTTRK